MTDKKPPVQNEAQPATDNQTETDVETDVETKEADEETGEETQQENDNDEEETQVAPVPAEPAANPTPAPDPATAAFTPATSASATTKPALPLEEVEATELIENITTPLVVELGRVNLTVLGIGDLRSGTIIELSKSPSDAVDLVVGGKSIGKGELVDVEGDLGVRIISLVK